MRTRAARRLRSLSLRARVAAAFGLVTLAVAALLSFTTWQLAATFMLNQRERGATEQAVIDARLVSDNLARGSPDLPALLVGLTGAPETGVVLRVGDQWTSVGQVDVNALPGDLLRTAGLGTPARQRLVVHGAPVLAVAVPVPTGGFFVELAPLTQLDRTLRFLSATLVAGTTAAAALGTLLGWWTTRRALRPVSDLTEAAARMAEGDLGARLPVPPENDLAPLAERFNTTAEALEQRVQRDARFASDVSHELRSPLTTMINAGEVLRRRRDELPEAARRAVDLLTADVARFHRMVEDLLEISRGLQAPATPDLEPVDLGVVVENLPADLVGGAAVDVERPAPLVLADRRRLDRVLANLCQNARVYAGGVTRIAVCRRQGHAVLEVDDDGPGIPAEFRDQIFERFARGPRPRRGGDSGGTGLGLALVAQHVHGHGGRVWAEDRAEGGTRFVVELPEVTR